MDTMIELPAMRRTAELAPNTADAQARTVEVVWSAGARVRRASFFGEPYDEELSLDPAHGGAARAGTAGLRDPDARL